MFIIKFNILTIRYIKKKNKKKRKANIEIDPLAQKKKGLHNTYFSNVACSQQLNQKEKRKKDSKWKNTVTIGAMQSIQKVT